MPAPDFTRAESEVAELTTVVDSAVALFGALSADLRAHADDPAKINAIADALDQQGNKLAAAIAANTPGA